MFKKMSVWSIVSIVLSLLLTFGSATLFKACALKDDGTWMRCHSAQTTITTLSAALTAALLLQALFPQKGLRVVLNLASVIGCTVIFLIPGTLMPMCMMHTMRCYTVMQPFVRIMAVLIAVCSLLQMIRILKGKAKS